MADFCLQCANYMGFTCDFENMMSEEQYEKGLVCDVLCEGCGPIQVNGKGRCMTVGCLENHTPDLDLKVGYQVEKIKGYKWPGVVVARFHTIKKEVRYVVECTVPEVKGALHIYSPKQIRKIG